MIYEISASSLWCWDKEECDNLLKKYPCLNHFGFKVEEKSKPTGKYVRDENGNRIWQEGPPRIYYKPTIKIDTLDDLNKLIEAVDSSLVYTSDTIEIYDTYRE